MFCNIYHNDNLNVLKTLENEIIHLTFTSPPYYNAKDYSYYETYDSYLHYLEKVFQEVFRITKEGRFCVINTSPVIVARTSRNTSSKRYPIPYDLNTIMQKIGFEFIDDIIWIKPEASVKNRNGTFFQNRLPLSYKPNVITENIMVYRKKTTKLIDWNLKQYSKEEKENSKILGNYESSNVWYIKPVFDKKHSAVFPLELCDKVIKYYSFENDTILDPFAGTGTVGLSALNIKRNSILIEQHENYIERLKEKLISFNHFLKVF